MKAVQGLTVLLVILFVLTLTAAPTVARKSAIDLGTLGGNETRASAINNRGQVVGSSETTPGVYHAFLWEQGTMTDLGTLGGDGSAALDINDRGQVVGCSDTASGVGHAFLWEKGTMTDLGTLVGDHSCATGINASGQMVGGTTIESGEYRAFLLDKGSMTDLGTLGGDHSEAYGINDRGQVIGWSEAWSSGDWRAFLWEDGNMIDLGSFEEQSHASAVNNRGQVIGWSDRSVRVAVLWEKGTMTHLGYPWYWGGEAHGINDCGQIVGDYHSGPPGWEGDAFLWEKGTVKNLGLEWDEAVAINDRGQAVLHANWHAFLLGNVGATGRLEIVKNLEPGSDPERFRLQIDGSTDNWKAGNGDTTGKQRVCAGTHKVGEEAAPGTDLDDYDASIECRDEGGNGRFVASGDGPGPLNVTVGEDDDIVCTITNERDTGKLEVIKDLEPDGDPGRFRLQIDGTTFRWKAGDGDSTGGKQVTVGKHTISEEAAPGTDLDVYDTSIDCRDKGGSGKVVASGDGPGPLHVTVGEDDDIVCTITNLGKLAPEPECEDLVLWNTLGSQREVENSPVGPDGTVAGGNFSEGMYGNAYLADHTENWLVAFPKEAVPTYAGTIEFWARLTDYPSSLGGGGGRPVFFEIYDGYAGAVMGLTGNNGAGGGGLTGYIGHGFHCATGSFGCCTYEQILGTNQVEDWHHYALVWDNNGLPGVAGGTKKVAVFLDGQPNSTIWHDYYGKDSEIIPIAGDELRLVSNYAISQGEVAMDNLIVWDRAVTDFSHRFIESPLQQIGWLEVIKSLEPDWDPGRFRLQIDGTTHNQKAGDGDSSGKKLVCPGQHSVSEEAAPGTYLADYDTSIECRDKDGSGKVIAAGDGPGPLDVTIGKDDDIVCTIANRRVSHKVYLPLVLRNGP